MNFVKQSVEMFQQPTLEIDILKKIELAGRNCYKSEANIKDESAETFIKNIIKKGHTSVLEHQYIIIKKSNNFSFNLDMIECLRDDSEFCYDELTVRHLEVTNFGTEQIVSGNIRAWRDIFIKMKQFVSRIEHFTPENEIFIDEICSLFCYLRDNREYGMFFEDINLIPKEEYNQIINFYETIKQFSVITENELFLLLKPMGLNRCLSEFVKHASMTARLITDRRIETEIVRHRFGSFSIESTRYCNYGTKGLTFINPKVFEQDEKFKKLDKNVKRKFYNEINKACKATEKYYNNAMNIYKSPQFARYVLLSGSKADIIMSARLKDWLHIFDYRILGVAGTPHPQIKEVMQKLYKQFGKAYKEVKVAYENIKR